MKNFVATSLQDEILLARYKRDGVVSLAIMPTMKQCELLQAIDPEADWSNLTSYEAQNYLSLFYYYHSKENKQ